MATPGQPTTLLHRIEEQRELTSASDKVVAGSTTLYNTHVWMLSESAIVGNCPFAQIYNSTCVTMLVQGLH